MTGIDHLFLRPSLTNARYSQHEDPSGKKTYENSGIPPTGVGGWFSFNLRIKRSHLMRIPPTASWWIVQVRPFAQPGFDQGCRYLAAGPRAGRSLADLVQELNESVSVEFRGK